MIIKFSFRGISLFCANDVPNNAIGGRHSFPSLRFTPSNWVSIFNLNVEIFYTY